MLEKACALATFGVSGNMFLSTTHKGSHTCHRILCLSRSCWTRWCGISRVLHLKWFTILCWICFDSYVLFPCGEFVEFVNYYSHCINRVKMLNDFTFFQTINFKMASFNIWPSYFNYSWLIEMFTDIPTQHTSKLAIPSLYHWKTFFDVDVCFLNLEQISYLLLNNAHPGSKAS